MTKQVVAYVRPDRDTVKGIKVMVSGAPKVAQAFLDREYKRADGPRWTLVQWLKRHRLHNPTVRVIREAR